MFVHGPDLVFDTPEEAKLQLDRPTIGEIAGCFYSHWHPDHMMGRRVWETRNADFLGWPPEAKRHRVTDVYLPQQVAADFREYLGAWAHLEFMVERGYIRVHELVDGDDVAFGDVTVRPFRLAADYVYAFELREGDRRLLARHGRARRLATRRPSCAGATSPCCRWGSVSTTRSPASG